MQHARYFSHGAATGAGSPGQRPQPTMRGETGATRRTRRRLLSDGESDGEAAQTTHAHTGEDEDNGVEGGHDGRAESAAAAGEEHAFNVERTTAYQRVQQVLRMRPEVAPDNRRRANLGEYVGLEDNLMGHGNDVLFARELFGDHRIRHEEAGYDEGRLQQFSTPGLHRRI